MFFFFFPEDSSAGAVDAYRAGIKNDKLTTTDVAKRLNVSRTALSKFLEGRPLSPVLLSGLMQVLSPESGLRLMLGHLRDEIRRGNQNPADFTIVQSGESSAVLNLLFRQMHGRPERIAELMDLALKWQRSDLESKMA